VPRSAEAGEADEAIEGNMKVSQEAGPRVGVAIVEIGSELVDVAACLRTDDQGQAHARFDFLEVSRRCLARSA
jgi:hypothetical protein